jgi:hypothetical protein
MTVKSVAAVAGDAYGDDGGGSSGAGGTVVAVIAAVNCVTSGQAC